MENKNIRKPASKSLLYYENNKLVEEINPSCSLLTFLYTSKLGSVLRLLLKRPFVSKSLTWYYDCRLSRCLIKKFIAKYKIDMSEYEKPIDAYKSFNDFFIRTLKANVRLINPNTGALVSPADSKLYAIANITSNDTFFIKQKPFDLKTFLGDQDLAGEFTSGSLFIFRLAPDNYHRFHFPCDCIPAAPKRISGVLESVNPIVYKQNIQPLVTNERVLMELESKEFGTLLMVAVGAMFVGKIVTTYTPGKEYKKGDEAGYFAFGGSTVVVLAKKNVFTIQKTFIKHSLQGYETAVKMGSVVNELVPPLLPGL